MSMLRENKRKWARRYAQIIRFVFLCCLLVPAGSVVGFIISTELTIKANAVLVQHGENQWSLGQTLAVFLALPNTYMVIKCAWVMVKRLHEQGSRGTSSRSRPPSMSV